MTDAEIAKSALKKLKDQKENFGFIDRFNVDENWLLIKVLEDYLKQIKEKKNG